MALKTHFTALAVGAPGAVGANVTASHIVQITSTGVAGAQAVTLPGRTLLESVATFNSTTGAAVAADVLIGTTAGGLDIISTTGSATAPVAVHKVRTAGKIYVSGAAGAAMPLTVVLKTTALD